MFSSVPLSNFLDFSLNGIIVGKNNILVVTNPLSLCPLLPGI